MAQLRNGPSIYFGDATQLGAKWTAAAEVLADSGSAGAAYIDVTDSRAARRGRGQHPSGLGGRGTVDSAVRAGDRICATANGGHLEHRSRRLNLR